MSPPIRRRRSPRFLHGALPMMAAALGLYVLMHSPMRDAIARRLGSDSRVCYFVCGGADAVTMAAAWALICLAALGAWITTDRSGAASWERPLVHGITWLGLIALPAATIGGIASWTGTALLRPPVGPLLSAIPAALIIGLGIHRGWRPRVAERRRTATPWLPRLVWGTAILLLLLSSAISLAFPPSGYDALSYHAPLGVFLWRDGNLTAFLDRAPGAYTLAMPGTLQLWYGLLLLAGGERLADLGQLPFALLGSAALYVFSRRLGLRRGAAHLAAAAFLLAPSVLMHTGIQTADLAGAGLLMALAALASAPLAIWTGPRMALLGLCLGLVVTAKLALLPGAVAVSGFVAAVTLLEARKRGNPRPLLRRLAIGAAVFALVAAPWWVRNAVRYGNPVYPAGIPLIGGGIFLSSHVPKIDREFVPRPVLWPLYPLLDRHSERSGLGALFLLGAILGPVAALRRARRRPLLLYLGLAGITLPAWWTLTNHDPRFLLALFGLSFVFVPFALSVVPRRHRRIGAGLLACATIFSAAVTIDQALRPLIHRPADRLRFYDEEWGVDPVVAALPEDEGILLHTGYASYSYPALYPLLGPERTRRVFVVDTDSDTDSIVGRMRRAGVRYAYAVTSPASMPIVSAVYREPRFELLHSSVVSEGWRAGTRRQLYRLK